MTIVRAGWRQLTKALNYCEQFAAGENSPNTFRDISPASHRPGCKLPCSHPSSQVEFDAALATGARLQLHATRSIAEALIRALRWAASSGC